MSHLLSTLHKLGVILIAFSSLLLIFALLSYVLGDGASPYFLRSTFVSVVVALLFIAVGWSFKMPMRRREGILLVFLAWISLAFVGGLPMYFAEYRVQEGFGLAHALFEGMSGLTTTGATVIHEVEELPLTVNLWRHSLLWFGGMGILLLAVAILPHFNVGGRELMQSEMPGPLKDEKLTPRIASTAKMLYGIYFVASLLCFLAYRLTGLSWFDAWCHAASTMALGGFSSFNQSFLSMNNPAAEMVAVGFMLFAGINFATHFKAFKLRDIRQYAYCPEAFLFLGLVLGSGLLVSVFLYSNEVYSHWYEAVRYGIFNTVSIATTTGFANTDYLVWPFVVPVLLLLLGSFASSGGSTGGGVKLIRVLLVFKQVRVEILRLLHPHGVFPVRFRQLAVSKTALISVMVFIAMYCLTIMVVFVLFAISGAHEIEALSAAVALVANIGPALGSVGPMGNYAHLSDFQLWVGSAAMLVGRLELFTVFVIFTPSFWRA